MESVKTAEVMLKGNASRKYIGMNTNGELYITVSTSHHIFNYENFMCLYGLSNTFEFSCKNNKQRLSIGFQQGVKRWHSGESARLPPMWGEFTSRTWRHIWVEFVVGSRPCSEGFSLGSPVFLPPV